MVHQVTTGTLSYSSSKGFTWYGHQIQGINLVVICLLLRVRQEDPGNPGASPTIATNNTVTYRQQANDTYGKVRWIFENAATMGEALKHQIIETIEDTYI